MKNLLLKMARKIINHYSSDPQFDFGNKIHYMGKEFIIASTTYTNIPTMSSANLEIRCYEVRNGEVS